MIWLEMSKNEAHGGKGWEFTKCLWAPAYKLVGEESKHANWAYWECVKDVHAGDIVLHLRGDKAPEFVGQSIAETDGFYTTLKPPAAGPNWEYAEMFYRVNLKDYIPFSQPISLRALFSDKRLEFEAYYKDNKKQKEKRLLFYAIQNSKLGCQNGAYLSEVDDALYQILFTERPTDANCIADRRKASVGEGLRVLPFRKGQNEFSGNVLKNFGCKCCFPGCSVTDRNFLIGSHIARWADYPEFRGETSNGLCLCLMHDKAFEMGLFTLDRELRVSVNEERIDKFHSPILDMREAAGRRIKDSEAPIDEKYVQLHWTRIGYEPKNSR